MAKDDLNNFVPKLKKYHLLLIVCLLSPILLLNINYNNNLRNKENTNNDKNNLFEKIISGRFLEEVEVENNTTKVCDKTSDNLKEYYKTGDKSILGIDDDEIKGEEGEHIQALINLFKIHFSKNVTNKRALEEKGGDDATLTNIITYGKHILPLIVFLGIAILSIPGWLICCICCCGNCCCCCCCKKNSCKLPSFVFSYICYGIVGLICFYGLSKSNSIFIGINDTECSILKFVDEVLEGETKENPPYWAGIEVITNILNRLSSKVEELKTGTEAKLNAQKTIIDEKKNNFEDTLETGSNAITSNYKGTYDSKEYQLDIAKNFGTFTKSTRTSSPENSICDLWFKEYNYTAANAEYFITETKKNFNILLKDNSVSQSLNKGKQSMKEIEEAFDDIKLKVAGNIIKYGDDIDKYGKLVFKILYTVLLLMDAGVAAFMLLLCFCSGRLCSCCCCPRVFCKFFIHILWNIMAIFMIALFMFGSLFTISGKVGKDMMSVVSYLVSEENLGENNDTILLGDVKKYLNRCFNKDGDILTELGFNMNSMNSFEGIKNAELQFEDIENEFKDKKNKFVYKEYLSQLDSRVEYKSEDLSLISTNANTNPLSYKFTDLLKDVNTESIRLDEKEKWDITSISSEACYSGTPTNNIIYHPKKCYPTDKVWVRSGTSLGTKIDILKDIKTFISTADGTTDPIPSHSIRNILNDLNEKYEAFLNSEIKAIDIYKQTIQNLTSIVYQFSGKDEGMFSFINCKFIKSNVQILLINLKNVFGNDIYMIGVYLLMAACSLAIAIILTILLVIIINVGVDSNKDNKKLATSEDKIDEIPLYSEGKMLKNTK